MEQGQSEFADYQLYLRTRPGAKAYNINNPLHQFDDLVLSSATSWQVAYLCSMDYIISYRLPGVEKLTSIRISNKHRIALWELCIGCSLASCTWSFISSVALETYLPKHNACNRSYVCPSAWYQCRDSSSSQQPPTRLVSFRQSRTLITQMPFHLDVNPAICQYYMIRCGGGLTLWAVLTAAPSIGQKISAPFPSIVRPIVWSDIRLSFNMNVPHKSNACTVAGEECSNPTAERHALPSKNNLSPLGSTGISSEDRYDVQGCLCRSNITPIAITKNTQANLCAFGAELVS